MSSAARRLTRHLETKEQAGPKKQQRTAEKPARDNHDMSSVHRNGSEDPEVSETKCPERKPDWFASAPGPYREPLLLLQLKG